ncbi:MAG: AcrR family transcriptional regulator [Candidatus Binatia bacterium]|jgi:AcrR family transcriptional regulator
MGESVPKTTRRRRTAAEATSQILDAAEARLREVGPEGLKLQEIARDVGVSHPAILHHFGSRQGLVQAVVRRALENLQGELLGMIREHTQGPEPVDLSAVMRRIYEVLAQRGHARLLAWLILSGQEIEDQQEYVRSLAEAGQVRMHQDGYINESREFEFDDMLFVVMLIAYTSLGAGVAGDAIRKSAGLADDPKVMDRFTGWFAHLIDNVLTGEANWVGARHFDKESPTSNSD